MALHALVSRFPFPEGWLKQMFSFQAWVNSIRCEDISVVPLQWANSPLETVLFERCRMLLVGQAKVVFGKEVSALYLEHRVWHILEHQWIEQSLDTPRSTIRIGKIEENTGTVSYWGLSCQFGFLACSCHCVSICAYPTNRTFTTHSFGSHSPGTVWLISISTNPTISWESWIQYQWWAHQPWKKVCLELWLFQDAFGNSLSSNSKACQRVLFFEVG